MRSWRQTVLSQYDQSNNLVSLLENIDEWISPDANLEDFFQFIWNIQKQGGAIGAGLDIWGRIVGVSRKLRVGAGSWFGFGEAGDRTGFNQSPFYAGQPTTYGFSLDDETYRLLIFAKAAYNLTNSSIPAINAIMMALFPGRGNAYVIDGNNGPHGLWFGFAEAQDRAVFDHGPFSDYAPPSHRGNMTLTYVFEFVLTPIEIAIVVSSGVLPKPVGVLANAKYL